MQRQIVLSLFSDNDKSDLVNSSIQHFDVPEVEVFKDGVEGFWEIRISRSAINKIEAFGKNSRRKETGGDT